MERYEVRKYGSGGGRGIGWVKFSTDVNRNGGARGGGMGSGAGSKSVVRLRDVRESHRGCWRV